MRKRLETLKNQLNLGWGELASAIGISRSMLDQVRKGERLFSPKTMRRLEELESRNAPGTQATTESDAKADFHTICTRMEQMERQLERIAVALEQLASSHNGEQKAEK